MNRIDYTDDNAFITELKSLRSDLDQLRTRQSIPRSLVTRTYLAQSTNTFDVNGYPIPANTIHYFSITFTGDKTQDYPYGVQFSQVYNGGTDVGHRLSDYQVQDATGTYYTWNLDGGVTGVDGYKYVVGWIIAVYAGGSGATVYIKARTLTTCGGSWVMTW